MSTLTTVLGYFVVVQFFFLDRARRGAQARSFAAGQTDQRSTLYIGVAYFASSLVLLSAWLLNALRLGRSPDWVGWLGLLAAILGLALRWWANRVLGEYYTRTLKVVEQQRIVEAGPYRLIRHPGYLGSILIWVGAAAATTNWIVCLVVLILMLAVYSYRIRTEEQMLAAANPEYEQYRRRTRKLIPLIY
jgi:protein-S-isoprenylcysteine O-methyltransferase